MVGGGGLRLWVVASSWQMARKWPDAQKWVKQSGDSFGLRKTSCQGFGGCPCWWSCWGVPGEVGGGGRMEKWSDGVDFPQKTDAYQSSSNAKADREVGLGCVF